MLKKVKFMWVKYWIDYSQGPQTPEIPQALLNVGNFVKH